MRGFGWRVVCASGLSLLTATGPSLARQRISHRPAVPMIGTLDGAILTAISARVSAYKAKDSFDTVPGYPELAGRPFRLTSALVGQSDWEGDGIGEYFYDPAKQVLTLSANAGLQDAELEGVPIEAESQMNFGYTFSYGRRSTGSSVETNGYGATIRVDQRAGHQFAVAELVSRAQSLPPFRGGHEFKLTVTPDQARTMVRKLRVVVEGVIRPLADGRSVLCGVTHSGATFGDPVESWMNTCVFPSTFTRVTIENVDTGEVIAEWPDGGK